MAGNSLLLDLLLAGEYGEQKTVNVDIVLPKDAFVEFSIAPPLKLIDFGWLVYDIVFGDFSSEDFDIFIQHKRFARHKIPLNAQLIAKGLNTFLLLQKAHPMSMKVINKDTVNPNTFSVTLFMIELPRTSLQKYKQLIQGYINILTITGEKYFYTNFHKLNANLEKLSNLKLPI